MADSFVFTDGRRLRRSGVAKQRISAHFAVAKRTNDFIFVVDPITGFFTLRIFFVQRGVTRGEFFLLSLLTNPSKILQARRLELKNKIIRSLRNGEVRTYMLLRNSAASQATQPSKP
jgi:hypothetical protein